MICWMVRFARRLNRSTSDPRIRLSADAYVFCRSVGAPPLWRVRLSQNTAHCVPRNQQFLVRRYDPGM